jgi:hypothetical protein
MQSAAAAATLAGVPLAGAPFVRGAHAAGKLSVAVWDHWVPSANDVLEKLCHEWAAKEKVEVTIDFVTSQGDKLMLMAPRRVRPAPGTTSSVSRAGTLRQRRTCGNRPTI